MNPESEKQSLILVINTGLSENLDYNLDFVGIKRALTRLYNVA